MTDPPEERKPDAEAVHKTFSSQCFNRAWDFIGKPERTPEEEEEMLRLAMASHWHWTQRKDYAPMNASIAYWQVSRVFALLGQPGNARRFGRRSLEVIEGKDVDPVYRGYAFEALARAEAIAGNTAEMRKHIKRAQKIAQTITDEETRELLFSDLATIAPE